MLEGKINMAESLNSVDDIDAMLASEFNLTDEAEADVEDQDGDVTTEPETESDVSTNTEDNVEDSNVSNENDENGSNDGTVSQESADKQTSSATSKPSNEDKRDYSFAQLRKDNAELKAREKELSGNDEFLRAIATQYGYDDVEDFKKAYEDARIQKEAKEKGYDPVLYKQLQDSNRRIEQLEKQNSQAKLMESANKFKNSMDKVMSDYNLGENSRDEIFTKLEESGYTVDMLLSLPNPEVVIKGVLSDKIAEFARQKEISKLETLDSLSDEKHDGVASNKSMSLDDIIKQEMQEYAKDNYFN